MQLNIDQYNGKLSLRIPRSLHRELVEQARIEGVSLNQYVMYRIAGSKPAYNLETLQAMYEAEHGIGLSKEYTDIDQMFRDILDGED